MRPKALQVVILILLTVSSVSLLQGQEPDSLSPVPTAEEADSLPRLDSLAENALPAFHIDSLSGDTIFHSKPLGGGVESEVEYDARDSLTFRLDEGIVEMFGKAFISYEDIQLEADYIRYEMDNNLVIARGLPDSTGKIVGNPVFTEKDNSFESKVLRYNFKTQKGYIKEVITEQEGGYLHAEETKKQDNGHVHLKNGKYTTCDAEHPHFYIAITKGISIPGDKIVAGPAYMVLADVPLPLGIPFGFFPNTKTNASGILLPKYGEENARGFYLRDGGYYFALNEYMDMKITSDIYSNGTWGVRLGSNYKLNYRFGGNISLKYFKNVSGYQDIGTHSISRDYQVGWSHNQDSRANPNSTFRASVNLSSSSYDRNHTRNINSVMRNTKQSSISYSRRWGNSPFNLSASLNHSQNSNTKAVNLTLPKVAFNMSRIKPFERKSKTGRKKWYEEIQLSYTSSLENRIATTDTALFTSSVWDDMKTGFKHSIPLSQSFKPFRKTPVLQSFSITPSINYNGVLYTKQTYKYLSYTESVDADGVLSYKATVNDSTINRLSYAHSLFPSIGSGYAPKIYGMYEFGEDSRVEAIRHVMSPSVSASYVPDMSNFQPNYYRTLIDTANNGKELQSYSIYEGNIYGTPTTRGASGSVSFSLRNNIEAKVRPKSDTIDEVEKVKIIDNLNFNTSYNIFHTDSLTPAWSAISFNGNTRVFKNKLNLSFRGSMDPFGYDSIRTRTRRTYFAQSGKPIRLTAFSVSAGFSFKSNQGKKGEAEDRSESPDDPVDGSLPGGKDPMGSYDPNIEDYYGDYVDFDIPWSLRFDYSFSYTKPRDKTKIVQTIRTSGDLSLSPKWKIGFNTGYDLDRKQFTTTNLSIYRDLHCWEMRISVVPFGAYKSYNFQINAKSAILSDLKYQKRRSWQDNW